MRTIGTKRPTEPQKSFENSVGTWLVNQLKCKTRTPPTKAANKQNATTIHVRSDKTIEGNTTEAQPKDNKKLLSTEQEPLQQQADEQTSQ